MVYQVRDSSSQRMSHCSALSVPAPPVASLQAKPIGGLIDYTKQRRDNLRTTFETKFKIHKAIIPESAKAKVSPKASSHSLMSKSLTHLDLDGEEERIAEFQLPIRRHVRTRSIERNLLVAEYERRSSLASQGSYETHFSRKSRRQSCSSPSIISSILRGIEGDARMSEKES